MSDTPFKSGSIALIGAPNAGKSTLLNEILGQKVAAVSPKPQTTRSRVAGILTNARMQAVLVDTPGIHDPERVGSPLNRVLVQIAEATLGEVDLVCWVIDALRASQRASEGKPVVAGVIEDIAARLQAAGATVIIALNKIDRVEKLWLLPVIEALHARLPEAEIVPISALKGEGVSTLLSAFARYLPEGEARFPEDQLLLDTERSVVAEMIREQVFRLTEAEIPYSTAVEIEKFDESGRERDKPEVEIYARILVERDSQKGILIGKKGAMLKAIGTRARRDIEGLLGCHVFLHLHVAVEKDWSRDPRHLRRLGLG